MIEDGDKMTKQDFILELEKNNISNSIVHFDDSRADGYCIRKNYFRWEVFSRERGIEYNIVGFPSENDALVYLLKELKRIYQSI